MTIIHDTTLQERISGLVGALGSLREVARQTHLDVGYLSHLASGDKTEPSAETLARLNLRRIVTYEHVPGVLGEGL